ncbi:MAG: DNA cytosine methyltransferase [Steroidobacteraceae bacterium]
MKGAPRLRRDKPIRRRACVGRPPGTVVDLFCGAGGLSHGFHLEGFDIVAGIDTDEACRYAFEHNNEALFIRRDIARLTAAEITPLFTPGQPKILVGCAPCQPFSTYNQKNSDPKWQLVGRFGDLITATLPDIVSMENVPSLLTFRAGRIFSTFVKKLEAAKYHVVWDVLYAPDFGLAQTRSRLVLLASRLGPISLPVPTHRRKHRTVKDEIGHLPPLKDGEVDARDPLHRASALTEINRRRIAAAKPGGSWKDWNRKLVADCHKAPTGKGYSSVYGRMSWGAPAPTITTQFFGFGNGRFGHPRQNRALSLREGALLQGFPAGYQFVAPGEPVHFTQVGQMIGNAVPVRLGRAIASSVKGHLESL